MTATVILYIGFSLYNCLEKTGQTVWKTWKTQGISFCQICKHPGYVLLTRTRFVTENTQSPHQCNYCLLIFYIY